MATVKLSLSENVYRRPRASNALPAQGYAPKGTLIEIDDIVFGREIEGNNVWYHSTDGFYYWSGGLSKELNSSFLLGSKEYDALSPNEQFALCRQAINDWFDYWKKTHTELNVVAVGVKQKNNVFKSNYSLVFHVEQKGNIKTKILPSFINYKGFLVPTDVLTGEQPKLCFSPGNKIFNARIDNSGTGGFIGKDSAGVLYLVTNYHVLCDDRRLSNLFTLNENDDCKREVFDDKKQHIATLVDGEFSEKVDCVKAKMLQTSQNILPDKSQFSKWKPASDLKPLDEIFFFGTVSKKKSGRVSSSSAHYELPLTLKLVHKFTDLIQINVLAKTGDSGAPVLTKDGLLIGILVCTDEKQFSYVVPIATILDKLKLRNHTNDLL